MRPRYDCYKYCTDCYIDDPAGCFDGGYEYVDSFDTLQECQELDIKLGIECTQWDLFIYDSVIETWTDLW